MSVSIGSRVPSFILKNQHGKPFDVTTLINHQAMVIYFYPKDETAGCTKQACAFRDSYQDFRDAGAEVIGISSDSEASHGSFADHHNLPFILLSDPGGEVRKLFGVPSDLMGLLPGRVTYIVGKDGIVSYIFNSQIRIQKHIEEALRVLKSSK
jgi:thioredoxin-dependent peroxiredoxin